jgi:hypothetical protein
LTKPTDVSPRCQPGKEAFGTQSLAPSSPAGEREGLKKLIIYVKIPEQLVALLHGVFG